MRGILETQKPNIEEQSSVIELQHINVKVLTQEDWNSIDPGLAVPVFHRWIQGQVLDELLLDVADYSHVPDGPGIVLIGHEADYALDNTDGRLGVRYNRKAPLPGTNGDRLLQATRSALGAFDRLSQELKLHFNGREIEIVVNDRLLAPNTEQTRLVAELDLRALLKRLFGGGGYSVKYQSEPRRLFGLVATAERGFSVSGLLDNLGPGQV